MVDTVSPSRVLKVLSHLSKTDRKVIVKFITKMDNELHDIKNAQKEITHVFCKECGGRMERDLTSLYTGYRCKFGRCGNLA